MESDNITGETEKDKKICQLFSELTFDTGNGIGNGKAADAKKDGAELLQPTTDTVTYDDGTTEEVNGFDVPVKALDKDFDLALIGTKGKWYDHTVSVTNPVKVD